MGAGDRFKVAISGLNGRISVLWKHFRGVGQRVLRPTAVGRPNALRFSRAGEGYPKTAVRKSLREVRPSHALPFIFRGPVRLLGPN